MSIKLNEAWHEVFKAKTNFEKVSCAVCRKGSSTKI